MAPPTAARASTSAPRGSAFLENSPNAGNLVMQLKTEKSDSSDSDANVFKVLRNRVVYEKPIKKRKLAKPREPETDSLPETQQEAESKPALANYESEEDDIIFTSDSREPVEVIDLTADSDSESPSNLRN